LILFTCTAGGLAQTSPNAPDTINSLRRQIEQAVDNHATHEQLGRMWLHLADVYQGERQLAEAEQAFGQAASLLDAPATRAIYANALHGLGSIYVASGRADEGLKCLQKSQAAYEGLGDRADAARVRQSTALALLMLGRNRDGERESAAAVKLLEADSAPDIDHLSLALLTHAYSLCLQHHCDVALQDVDRAAELVQAHFGPDSLQAATVLLARGYSQWKSGAIEEGGESLREALRMSRNLTNVSDGLTRDLRLNALQQYDNYLKATHHKPEARGVEEQITELRSAVPSVCRSCTVNVNALR